MAMTMNITLYSQNVISQRSEVLNKAGSMQLRTLEVVLEDTLVSQVYSFEIDKNALTTHRLSLAIVDSSLQMTSELGKTNNAFAAINGGFFNTKEYYSVTYLENDGTVIARTRSTAERRKAADYFLNGVMIVDTLGKISFENVKEDVFYENSANETLVFVAGPLLLENHEKPELPEIPFVEKRHPRSCICESKKTIRFIVVDGRSKNSSGINLHELQNMLLGDSFNCVNALNLDGGGSSTLWLNRGGKSSVINHPSDASGERKVHNAIMLVPNN